MVFLWALNNIRIYYWSSNILWFSILFLYSLSFFSIIDYFISDSQLLSSNQSNWPLRIQFGIQHLNQLHRSVTQNILLLGWDLVNPNISVILYAKWLQFLLNRSYLFPFLFVNYPWIQILVGQAHFFLIISNYNL